MWELGTSLFSVPDVQVPLCFTLKPAPPASEEMYFLQLEDPVMASTLLGKM